MSYIKLKLRPIFRPIVRFFLYFFYNTHFIDGNGKVSVGKRVGLANVFISTASGNVHIDDCTIFGYNVMVLTGKHLFHKGKRASLNTELTVGMDDLGWGGGKLEVPPFGHDIKIGKGCWIASGAIICGGVTIGDGCIIAAGAVVTKSFPDHSIVAGIPGRVIGSTLLHEINRI